MFEWSLLAEESVNSFGLDEVLAIIGGFYIIARAIIFVTPTARDDKAIEKVNKWLVRLKIITGLSLDQGVKKYRPK